MADGEETLALTLRRRRFTLDEYHRMGFEAWLVDLETFSVEVHRGATGGGYRDVRVPPAGEPFSPAAFPDLVVTLADLVG